MADSIMKTLINNIITFLESAITSGTITTDTRVYKGLQDDIEQIAQTQRRYIAIDDGGERTEIEDIGQGSQIHYYMVVVEIGTRSYKNLDDALDELLDLNQQVKDVFELEANKQLDGMTFGIEITPLSIPSDKKFFWRGRQIILEYHELEDRYNTF